MKLSCVYASLVLASASAAYASNITCSVTETAGNATTTGTITTDGTVGTLAQSNILSYTFTISNGASSDTFIEPGSQSVFVGTDLTASASGLFFNFGDTSDNRGGFILGVSPNSYEFCLLSDAQCNGYGNYPNGGAVVIFDNGSETQSAALTGDP